MPGILGAAAAAATTAGVDLVQCRGASEFEGFLDELSDGLLKLLELVLRMEELLDHHIGSQI